MASPIRHESCVKKNAQVRVRVRLGLGLGLRLRLGLVLGLVKMLSPRNTCVKDTRLLGSS